MSDDTKLALKVTLFFIFFLIAWAYASSVDLEILTLENK
tara:strand:+ start:317 stop:433 length:117 start_codon:yes stop_codon:yes gene_type:complete